MSAWPMIATCKEAQWRGLTPAEREWVTNRWRDMDGVGTGATVESSHRHIPVWQVVYLAPLLKHLDLISVKED